MGFISGDIKTYLVQDMKILHPSFLFAVPKVLANFRDNIMSKIAKMTGCKASIIERALRVKRENFEKDFEISDSLYDNFVLNKIHDEFGGKFRFILTGSAPLSKDLATDCKILFGCPIIEGYGMSETCGAVVATHITDYENESVGGPIMSARIKLVDYPALNYTSKTKTGDALTPCGEICVKGPLKFAGYFRNKEQTDEMIDKDGWLHTGDVGMLLLDKKRFKIIDRVKEIFKLLQGEYIAPSKLELAYGKSEYISNICVYGRTVMTYLIAIITVKKPEVLNWLKSKEWFKEGENVEDYFEDQRLHDEIKRSLEVHGKNNNLNSLEKIHKLIISKEEFTVENELFTPTAKLVRRKVEAKFKDQINKIYV